MSSTPNADGAKIAVILGWLRSKPRYLRRYNEFYQQAGYVTESSHFKAYGNTPLLNDLKQRVFAQMEAQPNAPIALHIFSGAGMLQLKNMWQEKERDKRLVAFFKRIKAITIDSAPISGTINEAIRAFSEGMPWYTRLVVSLIFKILSATRSLLSLIIRLVPLQSLRWISHYENHLFEKFNTILAMIGCPQLYLYSKKDAIVDWKHVQKFHNYQEVEYEIDVSHICFEDSNHVNHFRTYPQVYKSTLTTFLKKNINPHAFVTDQ